MFCSINILSNSYDEALELWYVLIEDLAAGQRATVRTRNIVLCVGSVASSANARYPDLGDRHFFRGPVLHAVDYTDDKPF